MHPTNKNLARRPRSLRFCYYLYIHSCHRLHQPETHRPEQGSDLHIPRNSRTTRYLLEKLPPSLIPFFHSCQWSLVTGLETPARQLVSDSTGLRSPWATCSQAHVDVYWMEGIVSSDVYFSSVSHIISPLIWNIWVR